MPTLSEAESKRALASHGVRFPEERQVPTVEAAVDAATEIGFPVAVKLGGAGIAHKTERGLVRLGVADPDAMAAAAGELLAAARPEDGDVHLLVAPMLRGDRELIAGLHRDEQFGMTVMLGIGGVLTEALGDVSFRLVPISRTDALEMIDDLGAQALLGEVRGQPQVDRGALADVLLGLSAAAESDASIVSADLNPLIVVDGQPVPVDALVEVA